MIEEQTNKERKFLKERMHIEEVNQNKLVKLKQHREAISQRRQHQIKEKDLLNRQKEAEIEDKLRKFKERQFKIA